MITKSLKQKIYRYKKNLLNMNRDIQHYDFSMEQVDNFILDLNPTYKMNKTKYYSRVYLDKYNDLNILKSKYKTNMLSEEDYEKLVASKLTEIKSYRREFLKLKKNEGGSLLTYFVNALLKEIEFRYIYEYGNIMFKDLSEEHQIEYLEKLYDDYIISLPLLDNISKDVFVKQVLIKLEENREARKNKK